MFSILILAPGMGEPSWFVTFPLMECCAFAPNDVASANIKSALEILVFIFFIKFEQEQGANSY